MEDLAKASRAARVSQGRSFSTASVSCVGSLGTAYRIAFRFA